MTEQFHHPAMREPYGAPEQAAPDWPGGAMPSQHWVFRARVLRVVDGDTCDLEIDVGLHGRRVERMRLLGVNAPEVHGPTRPAGLAATQYALSWLDSAATSPDPWPLIVQTSRSDVFGRFLSTVWRCLDGRCLNADLLAAGHAVPFRG